jgi:protein SCO1
VSSQLFIIWNLKRFPAGQAPHLAARRVEAQPARWLLVLVLALTLAGCSRNHTFHGTLYNPPRPAPAIPGINWDSQPFDLAELQGKVVLIFFGFTYCPDACPLTLAELRQLYSDLGEQADNVAVVFVSTDPDRDTPERLGQYVSLFDPGFYGVHVTPADLPTVKQAYGVFSERNTALAADSPDGYLIDHSGYIYVIDKNGDLRMAFGYSLPKDGLLADVRYLLAS